MSVYVSNVEGLTWVHPPSILGVLGASMPVEFLGQMLREFREAGGVTLRDLARELKMNETQLSKIEKGTRMAPDSEFMMRYLSTVQKIVTERAVKVGILKKES